MDSTGIKMMGEGEWKVKKHGADYRRQWRKLHLGIDAQTLEIRAMELADNRTGDATMLPELLSQIPEAEELATVSTDGVYDTRQCQAAIAQRGAAAIIPPRRNGQFWKGNAPGNQAHNESLRTMKYLGGTLWKKWSGYIGAAWWRQRCTASNYWQTGSSRGTSTGRSRSFKSVQPF